jgi:hypothetical protein
VHRQRFHRTQQNGHASSLRGLDDLPQAASFGVPIDLMGLLAEVPSIAAEHPGVPLVIDHLGHPAGGSWARDLEAAAACPNVYCKLTGLSLFVQPRPYVQLALALFGPGRLMFGSDWPRGLPEHSWKASLALFTQSIGAQPIDVREELLGGTAADRKRIPGEVVGQLMYSGAAFLIEHKDGAREEVYLAGVTGALKVYESLLAKRPHVRSPSLDSLIGRRDAGTLADHVAETMGACPPSGLKTR